MARKVSRFGVAKMLPVNSKLSCLISLLVCSSAFLSYRVDAKPANVSPVVDAIAKTVQPSQPTQPRSAEGSGRKVLTTWNEDGSWQASARLPTSSHSGGNDHSRYKIRRDGSLSLALQIPKPHLLSSNSNYNNQGLFRDELTSPSNFNPNWARDSKINVQHPGSGTSSIGSARHFSPAELRSFSVVISDVDVTGNYDNKAGEGNNHQDSYSQAGVSSYHLKSNSIHRMNASWKLKPGHAAPTSSDLLEFLSYFANGDRTTRSETLSQQQQQHPEQLQKPLRKILGQHGGDQVEDDEDDDNKQPFLTWSESSRNIPLSSSTEVVYKADSFPVIDATAAASNDDAITGDSQVNKTLMLGASMGSPSPTEATFTADTENDKSGSSSNSNEAKIVLHELISTLEKLNENVDEKDKSSVDIEKSSANQSKNTSSIEEEGTRTASSYTHAHPWLQQQPTELDQRGMTVSAESENKHQVEQQVDGEMTEPQSEKGDVFVNDDAADFGSNTNTTHNSTSFTPEHTLAVDGKRSAKSAFFQSKTKSTTSTNRTGRNNANNNATSTNTTTSLESGDSKQQRMKITDPQQTASDLKKLMSLILKSDGNRNGGGGGGGGGETKSGTQVVNIVITPNQDASSPTAASLAPQQKNNPQKIVFLKTPQVKQMLDIALSDPAVSSAAQKIAAALETNPFPNPIPTNIDHTYNSMPSYMMSHRVTQKPVMSNHNNHQFATLDEDAAHSNSLHNNEYDIDNEEVNVPSTPDGFPLTGTGFLNLHHPNLQFHQALHHLVVNGTTPTTINATTKTNIINIFVINFKENNHEGAGGSQANNQSPFKINIKPQSLQKPKLPFPITIKPLLIESVTPSADASYFFNNKMGLAAAAAVAAASNTNLNSDNIKTEGGGGASSEKNYEPNKNLDALSTAHFGLSNSDKINIFDLLPGDIGTVTAVQYAPGVGTDEKDYFPQHNPHRSNQTISPIIADNSNSNNNNKLSTFKPATMAYGDYFADFLPDRGRDPPRNEKKPQESENINEPDILSILSSSRKPVTPSSTMAPGSTLPPSLAHLEWIFKNQPPPKPQIPQTTILKRKGTPAFSGLASGEDDSMMEQEETSNSPFHHGSTTQELVEYLLRLQNVTRPSDSNALESFLELKVNTSRGSTNNSNESYSHFFPHSHNTSESSSDEHTVIEYTTKPPAFWKFGSKIPLGGFHNAEEALNNRLRKLLTAFGYSALPTIAAGAAATWPYWVPLVAAGRRRKRSYPFSPMHGEHISGIINKRVQLFLNNMTAPVRQSRKMAEDDGTISPIILSPSNRRLMSKSTKNSRREGVGEQKWIKVDVITTSNPSSPPSSSSSPSTSASASPTLLNFEMNSHPENGTSFHSQTHNSLRSKNNNNNGNGSRILLAHPFSTKDADDDVDDYVEKQKQHHPELDVPLLKNFLKNVLYNELSLSTKAPLPLFPPSGVPMQNAQQQQHQLNYDRNRPLPPILAFPFSPTTSSPSPPTEPVVLSQYPIFMSNLNKIKNDHLSTASGSSTQTQGATNNSPILLNTFSRPSSSPLFPEKQYNNGDDDEQMIAGSDKKVITISTPSPTSVYIHNRGDGTTSTVTTSSSLSSPSPSLVHKQNSPWGSSFGKPDKIATTSSSSFTTFANKPSAFHHHPSQIHMLNGANNHFDNHHAAADIYQKIANKKRKEAQHKLKLAESIRTAERSYASAALFPLWFPILFGNQSQVSSKLREALNKDPN